jgi:hypothetical protein
VAVKQFLERLGFSTKNEQGHEIGCMCRPCMVARELKRRKPFKPGTVGYLLQEAARKRREQREQRQLNMSDETGEWPSNGLGNDDEFE